MTSNDRGIDSYIIGTMRSMAQVKHEETEDVALLFLTPCTVESVRALRPTWSVYRLHEHVASARSLGMLIAIEGHEHPEVRMGDAFAPGRESARGSIISAAVPICQCEAGASLPRTTVYQAIGRTLDLARSRESKQ